MNSGGRLVNDAEHSAWFYDTACIFLAISLLIACSSGNKTSQQTASVPPPTPAKPIVSVVMDTVTGSINGAWQAVQAPLEDVNLKRAPIPETLKHISNPYLLPAPLNCSVLASEILTLNMVLGPDAAIAVGDQGGGLPSSWHDIKMPSWQNRQQYMQQGVQQSSNMMQEKAADLVRSKVDIIPYRNWVRRLSGADAHAKKVAQAYAAGQSRRSFLKGLSLGMGCQYIIY